MKMQIIAGILISREKFMLNWAKHEKSFITSGPDTLATECSKGLVLILSILCWALWPLTAGLFYVFFLGPVVQS